MTNIDKKDWPQFILDEKLVEDAVPYGDGHLKIDFVMSYSKRPGVAVLLTDGTIDLWSLDAFEGEDEYCAGPYDKVETGRFGEPAKLEDVVYTLRVLKMQR